MYGVYSQVGKWIVWYKRWLGIVKLYTNKIEYAYQWRIQIEKKSRFSKSTYYEYINIKWMLFCKSKANNIIKYREVVSL